VTIVQFSIHDVVFYLDSVSDSVTPVLRQPVVLTDTRYLAVSLETVQYRKMFTPDRRMGEGGGNSHSIFKFTVSTHAQLNYQSCNFLNHEECLTVQSIARVEE